MSESHGPFEDDSHRDCRTVFFEGSARPFWILQRDNPNYVRVAEELERAVHAKSPLVVGALDNVIMDVVEYVSFAPPPPAGAPSKDICAVQMRTGDITEQ